MRHEKFGGFMKKLSVLICSLALVIGTSASLSALDLTSYPSAFKQGNIAINAGIGLGSFGSVYGNTVVPPISATVDYALPIGNLPFSSVSRAPSIPTLPVRTAPIAMITPLLLSALVARITLTGT
jgi:hypothetical protein